MEAAKRTRLRNRLRRVRGQLAGVERMLDEDQDCIELLLQLSAIEGAVSRIRYLLLQHHVETCLIDALERGSAAERATTIDDLLQVVAKHAGR